MKRTLERFRKSSSNKNQLDEPYKQEMDDYDRQYFEKYPEQDVPFPADPEAAYDTKPLPTKDLANTEPMPAGNEEMDAVNEAATLEEALQKYDSRYSLEAVNAGTRSPQLATEMLLGIETKFADTMTPEQKEAVEMEIIQMGEAIARLPNQPAEKSAEWTNIKGMMDLTKVITLAQERAPEKVPALKEGLRQGIDRVDSRGPISEPIRLALEEFDNSDKSVPFDDIVEDIAFEGHKQNETKILLKAKKEHDEAKKREAAEEAAAAKSEADAVLANLIEIAKRNAEEAHRQDSDLPPTGLHPAVNPPTKTAATPQHSLFDDEDAAA